MKTFTRRTLPPGYVDIFTRYSKTADRDVHFVLCNNLDTLIWLANLASLELHISLSRTMEYTTPDLLLFDIDPEPPLTFDDVIEVAHIVKGYLEAAGILPYVKTSGRKGVHIVVPLVPGYRFEEVRSFAHDRGREIAKETPHVVAEFPRSQEPGTIFYRLPPERQREDHGSPVQSPGNPGGNGIGPAPVRWEELKKGVHPEHFNIRTILPGAGDPWRGILEDRQKI